MSDDQSLLDLPSHLRAQEAPLVDALKRLVRIPSVCDETQPGYPFGAAVDAALREALAIAAELGFQTRYGLDGYYGWAEFGAGDGLVGILGHVDVVPPGKSDDWRYGPFEAVETDGIVYGRGTQDDKGPLLASLFAARALLDAGFEPRKRVRFIFGADEETLWRCVAAYRANEELPQLGFSPDSRFPVTYAEKGLLQIELHGPNRSGLRLSGGAAFNAVPAQMAYDLQRQDELAAKLTEFGFEFTRREGSIEVHGKAAHAMEPEAGVNAIARLCLALSALGIGSGVIDFVAQEVAEDPNARSIFGDCADEASGKLTLNVARIDLGEVETLGLDLRIPVTVPKSEIDSRLRARAAGHGLECREVDWLAPLYLPRDHFVIETLMQVYREVSRDSASPPLSSGGATYARAIDNCVAFGALLPGDEQTEHQPNERVVLANLFKAMEIYAHGIRALAG